MKKEYAMALGAVVIWGTFSPVCKMLFNSMPEMEVLCIISAVATVVLFGACLFTGRFTREKLGQWSAKDAAIVCGLGLLGTFIYNVMYNYGIARLQAQEACIINYLWPIMTMLFCCLTIGEKLTVRKLLAVAISFFGIFVIVTHLDLKSFHPASPTGVIACLLAAVTYGLFSALNKRFFYDQYLALFVYYLITTVACMPFVVLGIGGAPVMPQGIGGVIGLLWTGIFINAIGYLLWCQALLNGSTAKIANLAYITPFTAIIVSRILLGEPISPFSIIGLLFIILGIVVQMKGSSAPETA